MKTRRADAGRFDSTLVLMTCSLLLLTPAWGATILSGNVSGTWTPSGSPYILAADCTVSSNQLLIIQPGTTVLVASNVSLAVSGGITALGTPEQPILFQGTSPTTYWKGIQCVYSNFTNQFHYCRMEKALNALVFSMYGGNHVWTAEILHCNFVDCVDGTVQCHVQANSPELPNAGSASFTPEIHNCVFDSGGNACIFVVFYNGNTALDAFAEPRLPGNIFKNLGGYAILLASDHNVDNSGGTNISKPIVMNNTVVGTLRGIEVMRRNFAPQIRNNVLARNSTALNNNLGDMPAIPDDLGAKYNCFFSNVVNFSGYPAIYGNVIQTNSNGTICDAFYNIFQDPQFLENDRYRLSSSSPCVDAGDPSITDVCFIFSRGTAISDIGAYGGPDACGWLTHGFAPVITRPPVSQSSCVGGNALFKVSVEGSEPLSYRWFFNGGNLLAGETSTNLSLINLQASQAGLYSVVVTNVFGSVTSAPARLVVNDACVDVNLYAGLNISGMVGRTYTIEWVTDLSATNWTFLTRKTLDAPQWLFIDTNTLFPCPVGTVNMPTQPIRPEHMDCGGRVSGVDGCSTTR